MKKLLLIQRNIVFGTLYDTFSVYLYFRTREFSIPTQNSISSAYCYFWLISINDHRITVLSERALLNSCMKYIIDKVRHNQWPKKDHIKKKHCWYVYRWEALNNSNPAKIICQHNVKAVGFDNCYCYFASSNIVSNWLYIHYICLYIVLLGLLKI